MEQERTRFIYNGEYYTGEIKIVTPEPVVEETPIVDEVLKVEVPKVEVEAPKIEEAPKVEVEAPKIEEAPKVEVEAPKIEIIDTRLKTDLGIEKTSTYKLINFEINNVRLRPYTSAMIYITIYTSKNKAVDRVVELVGEDYLKWSSNDDYLYYYIRENISKIYDN